jgi:hypothetical protein
MYLFYWTNKIASIYQVLHVVLKQVCAMEWLY